MRRAGQAVLFTMASSSRIVSAAASSRMAGLLLVVAVLSVAGTASALRMVQHRQRLPFLHHDGLAAMADKTPIVLWVGMGSSCAMYDSVIDLIRQCVGIDTYITCVRLAATSENEQKASFFMKGFQQLVVAHDQIAADPKLANGFHAIGFSQGGLLFRGYAETYSDPPIKNLITVGSPLQGVASFPYCATSTSFFCTVIYEAIHEIVYSAYAQNLCIQAGYFHDPTREELFTQKSTFLAPLNAGSSEKKNMFTALKKLVMVKFNQDTVVDPHESEWLGFYKPGSKSEILPMRETALYKDDTIGLKELDAANKLFFLATDGDHLEIKAEWFQENVCPFLKE